MSLRALQRRAAKLEKAGKPRPSPIALWYGSFEAWVESQVLPGIESGVLEADDMIEVVAALRLWEDTGVWDSAHPRAHQFAGSTPS